MKALRGLLVVNGLVFLLRAGLNLSRPTSFYLDEGAPENAKDAVRVLGITYAALGLIQLRTGRSNDDAAVRVVGGASLLFALGVALQALNQDPAPSDRFHQIRIASAAENLAVSALYAALLAAAERRARLTEGPRSGGK